MYSDGRNQGRCGRIYGDLMIKSEESSGGCSVPAEAVPGIRVVSDSEFA